MSGTATPLSLAAAARATRLKYPLVLEAVALRTLLLADYPHLKAKNPSSVHNACRCELGKELVNDPAVGIPDLDVDAAPAEPWQVEEGHYTWTTGTGRHFRLSVEQVDELFYNFSKHGLDLTQTQVINKFNLHTWQWNSLKAKLGLVKLSNVFSPWTEENTAPASLAHMMQEKMDARFTNRGLIIEQSYAASNTKELLKVVADAADNRYLNQKVLAELADRFPEAKVRYLLRTPAAVNGPEELVVTVADVHAGAKVTGLGLSPEYNLKQLYAYGQQIIDRTNATGAKNVWLALGGDFIETFSGKNHEDSWKGIELHGADVIAAAYEFIEFLLSGIRNVAGVLAVGGNHDRGAASSKEESTAEIAKAIFWYLRKSYGHLIDIDYQTEVIARHIGGIRYVMTHGGKGNTGNDSKTKDLLYNYGDPSCFTILLTAHLHSRMVKLDSHNKRHLVVPSLFTGNAYSENLGFTSTAGFLQISNDGHGFPVVIDTTLHPLPKVA